MILHQDKLELIQTLDNNLEFSNEFQVKKANDLGLSPQLLKGKKKVFSLIDQENNTLKGVLTVVEQNASFYLEDVLLESDVPIKTIVVKLLDVLFKENDANKIIVSLQYNQRTVQSDLQDLGFINKTVHIKMIDEQDIVQVFELTKEAYYI